MMPAEEDDPSAISIPRTDALMTEAVEMRKEDLPELRKRGVIRVLVEYNRTDFFVVRGELYGFEYELLKEYESFLNRSRHGSLRTRIVFVPMPLGDLIPALLAGKGDIVAAGLTVTPEREKAAAFSTHYVDKVAEVLVTPRNVIPPRSLEDLAGQTIYVLHNSSHAEHLRQLSRMLAQDGAGEIRIMEAPPEFTEEDLLEMTSAGIFPCAVSDSHTARIWSKVLPNLSVHSQIKLANDGRIAWAVRKDGRELLASINSFFHSNRDAALAKAHKLLPLYYENTKWVANPNGNEYTDKMRQYVRHFQESCSKSNFDWLMAAALSFQESRFDETLVSRMGAIGLMQVLPATGATLGFRNIRPARENIGAGVGYLDVLMHKDFADPAISDDQRIYFAMAAYNAGPNRVNRLRRIAEKVGLNPNVWFGNVEFVAMGALGEEVANYVANINKYYAAYKLSMDLADRRWKMREEVRKAGGPEASGSNSK